MKCNVCGTEQREENKYCSYCGAKLEYGLKMCESEDRGTDDRYEQGDSHKYGACEQDNHREAPTRDAGGFVGWMRKVAVQADALVAWSKGYGGIYLALSIAFLLTLLESAFTSALGCFMGIDFLGVIKAVIAVGGGFLIERAIVKYCLRKTCGIDQFEDLNLHIAWSFASGSILRFIVGIIFKRLFLSAILLLFLGATVATIFVLYALKECEEMKFYWKYFVVHVIIYVLFIVITMFALVQCARGVINALPLGLLNEL